MISPCTAGFDRSLISKRSSSSPTDHSNFHWCFDDSRRFDCPHWAIFDRLLPPLLRRFDLLPEMTLSFHLSSFVALSSTSLALVDAGCTSLQPTQYHAGRLWTIPFQLADRHCSVMRSQVSEAWEEALRSDIPQIASPRQQMHSS